MKRRSTFPGIIEESLYQVAQRFAAFKANRVEAGFAPLQEGVTIWDQVKVSFSPSFLL